MNLKEKKTAIVTGGTSNQFPAMAVLALNLADKCPDIADELVIFHDGISDDEQKKVNQIFPTRFINYRNPFSDKSSFNETITNYFSFMVFCKYECWRLLEEYKTVIWCDYDITFLQNVSELKNLDGYYCSFIQDHILARKFNTKLFWDYEEAAKKIPLFSKGICACLFVLNDTFPSYLSFYDMCIKTTVSYSKALYLPEEAIISLLFIENKIDYKKIDSKKYALQPRIEKITDMTKGIHACGQPKFWNGLENEQWNSYYQDWITKYHGESFHKTNVVSRIKKIIKYLLPYGVIKFYQKRKNGK